MQPAGHRGGAGLAEVAGVEGGHVARHVRVQLVDRDVLSGTEVARVEQAVEAVGMRELVVGQTVLIQAFWVASAQGAGAPLIGGTLAPRLTTGRFAAPFLVQCSIVSPAWPTC